MPSPRHVLPLAATLLLAAGHAAAQDDVIVGPRALGMGGANVATTDDHTAQHYNPAAFGFFATRGPDGVERVPADHTDVGRKRWGVGVDGSVGMTVHGRMAQYLDVLSEIDFDRLGQNGIQNVQDVRDVVRLANTLGQVDDPGNAVTGDANGGVGVRIGRFGLGVRTTFQASARVDTLDLTNLGLSTANINAQLAGSGATGDGTVQLFTPGQQAQLSGAGLNANSIEIIDLYARQGGVTSAEAQQFTDTIAQVSAATGGGGSLDNNLTSVRVDGFGLAEVPLTYGHPFGDRLSVGGSLKLMVGRVYGTSVLVFDEDAQSAIRAARDQYQQTINFGIDVGVMARLPWLQLGIIGRNLNAPTFKGFTANGRTFEDVTVDPQVTVGAALVPFTTLVLEADLDLLPASTTLAGYDTQRVSAGIEWNIARIVALRAGAYKNLAESDVPYVVTGGVGLNLWLARIDVAGAMSPERETFEGKSYPKEARASLGVMVDF